MTSFNPTSQSSAPESINSPSSFESGTPDEPRSKSGTVREMTGDAKRAAGNALGQAKERAAHMAQEKKQSAAAHIGRYGTALRDSARSVEGEDPNVAYFANRAAERIEQVADYVRATDLTGLRRDAEDIARRHPALFMGGMFLTGLVLGGLVKTSAKIMREENASSGHREIDETYGEPLGSSESFRSGQTANNF